MPVVTTDETMEDCPHIRKLVCSRAHELAPDKCITIRKCEILEMKDDLFHEHGIKARVLQDLDHRLRS